MNLLSLATHPTPNLFLAVIANPENKTLQTKNVNKCSPPTRDLLMSG